MTTLALKEEIGVHVCSAFRGEVGDFICLRSSRRNVPPRMHARAAVVGIRSGGVIRVESRRTVVVDNDCVVIIPAWHLYGLQSVPGRDSSAVTLLADIPQLKETVLSRLPGLVIAPNMFDSLSAIIGEEERVLHRIERPLPLPSLIEAWFAESTPLPPTHDGHYVTSLRPLRDYLMSHMNEAIPTTALVKKSGLTASHCIRAFGQQFGLPPHAYHVKLRLAAACELLTQGVRVATVAYDCGFSDQSHLSRKFKETYGLTPAAWAAAVAKTESDIYGSRMAAIASAAAPRKYATL